MLRFANLRLNCQTPYKGLNCRNFSMVRYFNLQTQLLVLLVLVSAKIFQEFFSVPSAWPLIVDFLSVFAILQLVGGYVRFLINNVRRLPHMAAAWAVSAESRRALSVLREFCQWMAVVFLTLRLTRWTGGWQAGWKLRGVEHYGNYFDTAIILLMISWTLSSRRVLRRLRSIDITSSRRLLFSYLLLIVGATLVLMMPFSLIEGQKLAFVDSVFTVVSALSVTGLTTVNVAETFSLTGQILILFLIQIGGLGIVILTAGLAAATLRRLSLNDSMAGRELYDIPDIGNMSQFLSKVLTLTLTLELIGTVILYFSLPPELPLRFFQALFHSVSAFCNAGFSVLPKGLEDSPFSIVGISSLCVLIVVGGLGFPVLFNIIAHLKPSRRYRSLAAHTQLTIWMSFVLLFMGSLGIFLMETFSGKPFLAPWERIGQSVFYAISSRTAGFNMVPVDKLSTTSILVIMLLMFVGAGPMSTAGGIKTSTLGVFVAAAYSTLRGRPFAQFRNREIPLTTVMRAITGLTLYVLVAATAILILILSENIDPWAIMFEVISAMSTVGLSLGVTADFSVFGKVVLIFLMFMGRVGLVTFVYAGVGKVDNQRYRVPADKFFVG